MDTVLTSRVDDLKTRENPWRRRLARAGGVLAGALVCFFLLKGAAMASRDTGFDAPLPPDAGFGAQVRFWIAGPDPVSRALAATFRGPAH
ncbi:MAG TPA: hypothetical protein PLG62_14685 [Pararhodobacter sp.]|nr:hypothetical protein [Pararhodobacter sp.]